MIIAYEKDGISKERQATPEEVAYIEAAQLDAKNAKTEEESALIQRASEKAALLERLGITADEAALLLG